MAGGEVVACGPPSLILDSSILSSVYQTPLRVVRHPDTGRPVVLPAFAGSKPASANSIKRAGA